MRWVIDAIEEGMASVELEDGKMITIPRAALPKGAKPGDVLTLDIDHAATKQAVAESAAQVARGREASKRKDKGGDIAL
jgi:hypothetical protein